MHVINCGNSITQYVIVMSDTLPAEASVKVTCIFPSTQHLAVDGAWLGRVNFYRGREFSTLMGWLDR